MTEEHEQQVSFFDDRPSGDTALEVNRLLSGQRTAKFIPGSNSLRTADGNAYVPRGALTSNKDMLLNAAKGRWSWVDRATLPREVDGDALVAELTRNIENKRIARRASESYGTKLAFTRDPTDGTSLAEMILDERDSTRNYDLLPQLLYGHVTGATAALSAEGMRQVMQHFDALVQPIIDLAISSNNKTAGIRAGLEAAAVLRGLMEAVPGEPLPSDVPGEPPSPSSGEGEGDGEGEGQDEDGQGQGQDGEGEDKDGQGNGAEGDSQQEGNDPDATTGTRGRQGSDAISDAVRTSIDRIMDAVEWSGGEYDRTEALTHMPSLSEVTVVDTGIAIQVPNTVDHKVRLALNLDGRKPDYGRRSRHGTPTNKIHRLRFGDMKVFQETTPVSTDLTFLVDNSSSTDAANSGVGGAIWKYVGAISDSFPGSKIFMYHGGRRSVSITEIEHGYRPASNNIYEKKKGRINEADGAFMAAVGGTPDAEALLWIDNYLRNAGETVLIHICDGGPNDPEATRTVAQMLYEKGMRYATILVDYREHGDVIYPADITAEVSRWCSDSDWHKISEILDYVMER